MENESRFLKGFLSGLCVMLVVVGVFFFVKGEMLKKANVRITGDAKTENQQGETEANRTLDLDMDKLETKIGNIQDVINQYYLDEIDVDQVENWLYKGLVAGLGDDYATYYTIDELTASNEATSGQYKGIGATLTQDKTTGLVTVVKCYEGAPAAEAGLLPGDIIYKLNDNVVTSMELTDVVAKIKTEEGETIKITVAREGEVDYLDFDVERRAVEVPTVTYEMMEGNMGYIKIQEFDTVTEEQFKTALHTLEEQGMEKLIIDLRDNLGGVLQTTCNMLEEILPKGLIVYMEDKAGNRTEYFSEGKNEFDKPLVILTNGNSASASEIFAGAVKDYGIGTIVGTTTYGKGIVQRTVMLEDKTAVKLTIAKYYTPNGNDIHGVGVVPDVEVELDEALKKQNTIEEEDDNQLQKAIEVLNNNQ